MTTVVAEEKEAVEVVGQIWIEATEMDVIAETATMIDRATTETADVEDPETDVNAHLASAITAEAIETTEEITAAADAEEALVLVVQAEDAALALVDVMMKMSFH